VKTSFFILILSTLINIVSGFMLLHDSLQYGLQDQPSAQKLSILKKSVYRIVIITD